MVDITRNGIMNQKREPSFAVLPVTEAEILAVAGAVNLPSRCIVLGVHANVITPSTTAGSQVSLLAGAVPIATDMAVTVAGVIPEATLAPVYLPTGGLVTIVGGTTPPAAGDLVSEYIIEYIELDKVSGEYTA